MPYVVTSVVVPSYSYTYSLPESSVEAGVPVFFHPYDGGAGEMSQVTGAMEALRKLAGPRAFLPAGDSKLLSYANIAAMITAPVTFLAPAPKSLVPAQFTAQRDARLPAGQRSRYRLIEDTMTVTGPRKTDPACTVRRVLVHSSARADAASHARDKKLARAREDLQRLERGLGSRHYITAGKVTARLAVIADSRHVGDYLRAAVTAAPAGKPALHWHFDQAAINAEAATDGWYAPRRELPDNRESKVPFGGLRAQVA